MGQIMRDYQKDFCLVKSGWGMVDRNEGCSRVCGDLIGGKIIGGIDMLGNDVEDGDNDR